MPNINDIAKKTGFSKSTISRYLNNGSVSKKTKEKIKKAIDELGYVPNKYAQSLKSSSTKTIGVVIPNFIGYTKNIALDAINSYLLASEYSMIISCSDDKVDEEIKILNNMIKLNVDGIIFFASKITKAHREVFRNIDIPLIIYGQQVRGMYSVGSNDLMAGKLMGSYIKTLNHKEITFLDIGSYDKAVTKRFKGMKSILDHENIKINHHIVNFKKERAYDKVLEVYEKENSTFYLGATDNIAFGIINALHNLNVDIPGQVSVAGFGDYEISNIVNPSLTTVNFSYEDSGLKAIKYLLDLINKKEVAKETLLDCKLIVRDSTGRVK